MDEEIKKMLEDEIKTHITGLSTMQTGSKEKIGAINELTALYRLKIEETKNELDCDDKRVKREQLEEQVKDRYFKLGIAVAEITLPLIFYAVWMYKGLKFEETGSINSTVFRGLVSRFRPTGKVA